MATAMTKTAVPANAPSEDELLRTVKNEYAAGETALVGAFDHYKLSTEAIFLTSSIYHTTQEKIAAALGKSQQTISRMLKWRKGGYKGSSPFEEHHKIAADKAKKLAADPTMASNAIKDKLDSVAIKFGKVVKDEILKKVGANETHLTGSTPKLREKLHEALNSQLKEKPTMRQVTRTMPVAAPSATAFSEFKYSADTWLPKMSSADRARAVAYVDALAAKLNK